MVDFAALTVTAQRLISENGRSITLVSFDDTLQNPSRPWLGPADPRATPASTLVVDAVFVPPSGAAALGLSLQTVDLLKNAEQVAIISPGVDVGLEPFQEIIDGTTRWKIMMTEVLRPASQTVLAFLGVVR